MKSAGLTVFTVIFILLLSSLSWSANFTAATTNGISPYTPATAVFASFSSNGKQGLALTIASGSNHYLRIMHGDGTGALSSPTDLSLPFDPLTPTISGSVIAADFNADGITDLAVSNPGSNSISVFIGNGDGTFASRVDYTVGSGPTSMALGDFKGDGTRDDIAVVNSASNSVAILLNDGTGTMTVQSSGSWPTTAGTISGIAIADLNGDDIEDIAVTLNSLNKVTVFRGSGVGTFLTGIDLTVGANPLALVAADFNNDGIGDLAIVNSGDATISIIIGNKSGTFYVISSYNVYSPADSTANPVAITAGDFNRDGVTDLAIANNGKGSISLLMGKGDASFQVPEIFATGDAPTAIASGNLNGNGNDLLTLSNTNSSYSLLMNSSPAVAGITVTPGSYDFGYFQIGHLMYIPTLLTIANMGSASLTISSMNISGTNRDDFQLWTTNGTCATATPTIAAGSSCTVQLRAMNPKTEGVKSASLDIASNAANNIAMSIPVTDTCVQNTTPYTAYLSFIGRGSGNVVFSQGGGTCTSNCIRTPSANIYLTSNPDSGSYLYGWNGCDSVSSGSCVINSLSDPHDRHISVNFGIIARRVAGADIYTPTLGAAYNAAIDGELIKVQTGYFDEHLVLNRNGINIIIKGGYDNTFTTQGTAPTILRSLTVSAGSVVIDNLSLQ